MRKNDISLYISNVLILTPAIASFIFIFPVEKNYWETWVILLFVLPFVKYFSPRDYRSRVYPLTMIVILVYILVSDLVLLTHDSFIGSGLFRYPITKGNFTPSMFTLSTGIVFPLLFEGVLSKKPLEQFHTWSFPQLPPYICSQHLHLHLMFSSEK